MKIKISIKVEECTSYVFGKKGVYIVKIENGNGEYVKETTIRQKSRQQPKATKGLQRSEKIPQFFAIERDIMDNVSLRNPTSFTFQQITV